MAMHNPSAVFHAIKEAVEKAVEKFGIEGVKSLSMFPSSQKQDAIEDKAA